jgi:predicted nucleic acid-binding protein
MQDPPRDGKKGWSSKTLSTFLERLKAGVVVPSDHDVCREYGQLRAGLQKAGIVVGDNDLWIAACALRHSIPLIVWVDGNAEPPKRHMRRNDL